MKRKGMGKGMGTGYKNIIGQDPVVHSQSARGLKQKVDVWLPPKLVDATGETKRINDDISRFIKSFREKEFSLEFTVGYVEGTKEGVRRKLNLQLKSLDQLIELVNTYLKKPDTYTWVQAEELKRILHKLKLWKHRVNGKLKEATQ